VTECVETAVTIEERLSIDALRESWENLLNRTYDDTIFVSPVWLQVWCEHFSPKRPYLLTLEDDQGVSGLLPLQTIERDAESVLTLLGDPEVMDYMDGLAERDLAETILRALWTRALDEIRWDRIELRHVPAESPLLPALSSLLESRGRSVRIEDEEVDPVVALPGTWDDYLQTLSKKQRHEIRRKLRRAEEGAEWEWRTAGSRADLERDLPVFFRLHEASAHDKARFMTPAMRTFFSGLASTFLRRGELKLSIFRRDGVDIAATMSFLWRGRLLLYNSGYDPEYAAYSPGIAAVAKTIQGAIDDGARIFDFLSGDEPYKYQFGATNTFTKRLEA